MISNRNLRDKTDQQTIRDGRKNSDIEDNIEEMVNLVKENEKSKLTLAKIFQEICDTM